MPRHRILAVATAPLAAALALLAAPADLARAADFRLDALPQTLERALYLTAPPGDERRLFVVQQSGEIRIIRDGALLGRPLLDVGAEISGGTEQGLLGLAFHPDYAENGRFYINTTNPDGDTRVIEYRVKPDRPQEADPASARTVIGYAQPFSNHNGGHLAFGPDGHLYISSGDGGSAGDPQGNGQRLDTLLGKILRIDVDARDGNLGYGIPADNPFVGRQGARPEIFALGLRNPWRFSFDRERGDLWIGDVGQNAIEEIDFLAAGSPGGANYGWKAFEGTRRFSDTPVNGTAIPPVAEYTHDVGCSVTGGFVYRGTDIPGLRGRYLYADFCTGVVFSQGAGPTPGIARRVEGLNATLSAVTSFGQDARGELYMMQSDGTIYRLARPEGRAVTLSRAQLAINQRIAQAAVRRVNALEARFEGRPVPNPPDTPKGKVTLSVGQLLINQRISQAAVRRVNALTARVEGRPVPAARPAKGGTLTLSATQLRINQRISQAAVRRVNALEGRITAAEASP